MLSNFRYIEFFVANAKQASYYYRSVFGFEGYAYSGPETGADGLVSYVLKQNKIYFVFTSALSEEHRISKWVRLHGDGVSEIAFNSNSVNVTYTMPRLGRELGALKYKGGVYESERDEDCIFRVE